MAWDTYLGEIHTMGLSNPIHIAFVLILLLLVFGAKRLPEMGRSLGAAMHGFKDSISGETPEPSLTAQQQEPSPIAAKAPALTPVVTAAGQPRTPAA